MLPSPVGGSAMTYYRLYFMSARTGHIIRFAEYEAPDDESATALAREQECDDALELWSHHRKVARIEAIDPVSRIVARWQIELDKRTRPIESEA